MLRPPLPYVNCCGTDHTAPGVLNDVLNQSARSGLSSLPEPFRSGRLPPELETEVCSTGVNGRPVCSVRIPLVSQPPRIAFAAAEPKLCLRPLPNGRA